MTTLTVCRRCRGEGEVFGNPAWPDPQGETSSFCPRCAGTGLEPSDANWHDRLQDERATHHGELPDDLTNVTPASLRRDPAAPSRSVDDPQAPPTPTSRSAALAEPSTGRRTR